MKMRKLRMILKLKKLDISQALMSIVESIPKGRIQNLFSRKLNSFSMMKMQKIEF
jgi:hypothetical protein